MRVGAEVMIKIPEDTLWATLEVIGAGLIVAGVSRYNLGAGLIVAGLLTIFVVWGAQTHEPTDSGTP